MIKGIRNQFFILNDITIIYEHKNKTLSKKLMVIEAG